MANINLDSIRRQLIQAGTWGNLSRAHYSVTLAAAQIDDVIYFGRLPAGCTITDFRAVNAALGAGTTLKFGYVRVNADGSLAPADDYFLAATATNAAGSNRIKATAMPFKTPEDVYVVGTLAGGAATGRVDVIVDYHYQNIVG